MKSLSKSIQSLCIASALLAPLTAKCDVFVLKDGTRLKGKIISRTYEYYTLKVEIAENVLGDKKVLVKDVVEILKDDASIKDFKRIKKIFPTGDFLSLEDYETIKKDYFLKFYADHPRSKHTKEVEKLQKSIDEEYETLKAGGAKIDGELLSKAQIDANKYEVMAIIHLHQLEHEIETNKHISALRTFEIMERNFIHTRPFPKAVKAIQKILPEFVEDITELSESVEAEVKKRERYIVRMAPADKARIIRLLEKEDADYQVSLLNAQEELKTKWLPLNKYQKEPIDIVLKNAQSEMKRLEKFSTQKYEDGGRIYRDILAAIQSKDHELGRKLLSEFQRINPPETYLNELKVAILEIKDKAEALKERERQAAIEAAKAEAARKKAELEAKKNGADKDDKTKETEKATK